MLSWIPLLTVNGMENLEVAPWEGIQEGTNPLCDPRIAPISKKFTSLRVEIIRNRILIGADLEREQLRELLIQAGIVILSEETEELECILFEQQRRHSSGDQDKKPSKISHQEPDHIYKIETDY